MMQQRLTPVAANSQCARAAGARVVIADDNDLARAGLHAIVCSLPGLALVGEAINGRQAVDLCRNLRPDLALLDVRMPEQDGLAAARAIRAVAPETRVILITVHNKLEYWLAAVWAGASGYLLKDASRQEILTAIRRVLAGEKLLTAEGAKRLHRQMAASGAAPSIDAYLLTVREIQVLRLVAAGETNQGIAAKLTISRGTVKVHVERILAKLGVADRTQAAVHAIRLGIISGGDTSVL